MNAASSLESLLLPPSLTGRVSAVEVDYTATQLQALYQAVTEQISALVEAGISHRSTEVNYEANRVLMKVRGDTEAAQAEVQRRFGNAVLVTEAQDEIVPAVCNNRNSCGPELRGGTSTTTSSVTCQLGFAGSDRNTGARYMVTAAHCGRVSTNWSHAGLVIGANDRNADQIFGARYGYDATRIRENSASFYTGPRMYRNGGDRAYAFKVLETPSGHRSGVTYCWTGLDRDGEHCALGGYGPITVSYYDDVYNGTYTIPNSHYFRAFIECARPGDSGGPVFAFNYQIGGIFASTAPCTNADEYTYYTLALYVLDALNLNAVLSP